MKKERGREYFMKKMRRRMMLKKIMSVLFAVSVLFLLYFSACFSVKTKRPVYDNISLYALESYNCPLKEAEFYASDLCVSASDVSLEGYEPDASLTATALFDTGAAKVVQAYNLYGAVYPASTTKLLTAYVALKYGKDDDVDVLKNDIVTVGANVPDFPWDAQVCGLKGNDEISLFDLLCGLLLYSGNDCGRAIAEHISGTEDEFVDLMNEEAYKIGAAGTHFVNSHGLHSDRHFTTAYDLYLIFLECMKYPAFNEIIAMNEYVAHIKDAKGQTREVKWPVTNHYSAGTAELPESLTGLGGKTGYTHEAGSCLVYSSKDEEGDIFISIVMGADKRDILYEQMNSLLLEGAL